MSVNSEMTALADAIRNKSGVTEKLSISGMTAAINLISDGGGTSVDLSFVTAGADQILVGYVGADAQGNPINGELSDLWYSTVIVESWHPQRPGCTGLSEIIVSGLGSDYASANGTYEVTEETERIAAPFERIYKHSSGEWYIWGEYEPEYEEGYWHIGPSPDSGSLAYWTTEALADGTFTFEDWDSGDSFDVTLDVTETAYEEQPAEAVVVPQVTTSEDPEFIVYSWDVIPQVGRTYNCSNSNTPCPYLFGRAKDIGNGIDGEGLTLLTRWGLPGGSGDTEGRFILDETGMCEIRRLDNTDLVSTTSYTKSLFGNRLIDFKYFNSNEGAVLIKKLPLLDAFTVEFWAFMKDQRPDLWGGYVMVNRTKWYKTGELGDSTVVKASTNTSHAIYKQWYHHAFTHGAGSSLIKEWVNGVVVAEHDFSIPLGGDDEFLFAPASRGGNTSAKYVAQLAIWDRALSDTDGMDALRYHEIEDIVHYKQPYNL